MKIMISVLLVLALAQQPAPGSIIQGQILKPDNMPAAGMIVELLGQPVGNVGSRQWPPSQGKTTTDDRGQFRISPPGPGTYFLRVINKPATAGTHAVKWVPTSYFPGVLNGALASPLVVQGQNVTADLTIPQGNPYTVSGKVTSSGQNSLPPVQLILVRRDFGAPGESTPESLELLNLAAGSNGAFEIQEVPSGSYELLARSRVGDQTWTARSEFDISDRDIDNISLVLEAGPK